MSRTEKGSKGNGEGILMTDIISEVVWVRRRTLLTQSLQEETLISRRQRLDRDFPPHTPFYCLKLLSHV